MLRSTNWLVYLCLVVPLIGYAKPVQHNYSEILSQVKNVGTAKLSVLFWDIYQSSLYTTTGRYEQGGVEQPILFHIRYLRDIKASDLVEKTAEQWRHIGITEQEYSTFLPQLNAIWPDIADGDSLSLYVKDGVSYFFFNQALIGQIDDQKFGQLFLDIWLSPNTSQPKLRKKLIGVSS